MRRISCFVVTRYFALLMKNEPIFGEPPAPEACSAALMVSSYSFSARAARPMIEKLTSTSAIGWPGVLQRLIALLHRALIDIDLAAQLPEFLRHLCHALLLVIQRRRIVAH